MLILVCLCIVILSKLLKPAEHLPFSTSQITKKKIKYVNSCQSTNDGHPSALCNRALQAALGHEWTKCPWKTLIQSLVLVFKAEKIRLLTRSINSTQVKLFSVFWESIWNSGIFVAGEGLIGLTCLLKHWGVSCFIRLFCFGFFQSSTLCNYKNKSTVNLKEILCTSSKIQRVKMCVNEIMKQNQLNPSEVLFNCCVAQLFIKMLCL